ncbi:MAG: LPS export ABC transporter periplasmic protein LptC [Deltaproteobacteria bacterium]|nr:LPS export ABC transporter periplasmic protein LptC [Deltaproteobacteria bacterium]
MIRYSPLAVIILLILSIGFYLTKDRHSDTSPSFIQEQDSRDGLKGTNIHHIQNNPDNGVKWILHAEEVTSSTDMQHMMFKNFQIRLEPENGSSMELEGEGGEYNSRTQEINLWGALQGRTIDGYQILTDHMVIHQKERYLKTDEPVKIIGPFFSINGKGFFFNMETEIFSILSEVTTFIHRESVSL